MTGKPSEDILQSSDTGRSARPLKYVRRVSFDELLDLEEGGRLPGVTVAYETYGRLNEAKDNAVLICHALSGDSHVARHDEQDDPGWWDTMVGAGKPIDTDRYFVICPNLLGGCRGTTGPNSTNPEAGRPYGQDFPTVTVGDMVEVQRRLLDHLGVGRLLAAIGGSLGGHQVLTWAIRYPDRLRGAVPIAASARLSSQALAFDIVGRNAILRDPNYRDGQYYDGGAGPETGLAIARMIGHITYLSREAMGEKFETDRYRPPQVATGFEKAFSVGTYLGYQGEKFVDRFDANSYVTLTMAMDLFDLGATHEELAEALAPSRCRWLVISYTSDWLFSPEESRQIVDALIAGNKPVSYCSVEAKGGHDSFLLPEALDRHGELVSAFLHNLAESPAPPPAPPEEEAHHCPTSIFTHRVDYDSILGLIPRGASVLDLGCGHGVLPSLLRQRGHDRVQGVEINERAIVGSVQRGLDVVHADLNEGLKQFGDNQFDYVVLSRTLQAVLDVEGVLDDMLRVGRRCIVSFPNFAYRKLRDIVAEQGRAPVSSGVLRYKWYDTPNIRFLSLADFEDFCRDKGIRVHKRVAFDTEEDGEVTDRPNLNADLALFVISR